jgi:hypothetical protein
MNYSNYSEVKNIINFFNDATFLSLLNENTALIQNNATKDVWSLPFSGSKRDIVFHGDKAQLEESAPIEEEEKELKDAMKAILRGDSLEDWKETILEAMSKKRKKKSSCGTMNEGEEELIFPSPLYESFSEEQVSFLQKFEESWNEKVHSVIKSIKEPLFNCGNLFEDNKIKPIDIANPIAILEDYAMKGELKEIEFSGAEKIFSWNEEVKKTFGTGIKIDPFTKSLDIDITKAIVESKKNGATLNNRETLKSLKETHNSLFEGTLVNFGLGSDSTPGSYNGENKLNFLKFSGTFTNTDLEKLCDDFSHVLSNFNSLSQEDLKNIQDMKNKAEYMYRTNAIDDEEVTKIISSFNSTYGRDSRDKYRDPNYSTGRIVANTNLPAEPAPVGV